MARQTVTYVLLVVALAAALLPLCSAAEEASRDRGRDRDGDGGGGKRHTVTISGLKFKPPTIEIEPGDTVVWVNKDDGEHTVVADDGSFDSGRIRSGKSYERKFDKPGKYNYGDDLHPRMKGVVIVKEKK